MGYDQLFMQTFLLLVLPIHNRVQLINCAADCMLSLALHLGHHSDLLS